MFTFTAEQLEQFLLSVIISFAGEDGIYDFSRVEDNTRQMVVNRAIAALEASQPQRDTLLENSLPAIDEDEAEFDYDAYFADLEAKEAIEIEKEMEAYNVIPFDGQPIPYESDSDSPAELGLPPAA